jgi:hypothetical protein
MVKGTRTNKFHSFNNSVLHVIHFHTLCTQCLLVKNTVETTERSSYLEFFDFVF